MTTVAIPVGGISLDSTGANLLQAVCGATISSGAGVYRDVADDMELKALDVTDILSATAFGFLLDDSTNGNGAVVVPSGEILSGWAGLTKWSTYFFDTGGSLTDDPGTDLASGEYVVIAGLAISTTQILTNIVFTGETI